MGYIKYINVHSSQSAGCPKRRRQNDRMNLTFLHFSTPTVFTGHIDKCYTPQQTFLGWLFGMMWQQVRLITGYIQGQMTFSEVEVVGAAVA